MPPIARHAYLTTMLRSPGSAWDRPICRLGLASRGDTGLTPIDVRYALDRGVNFLNWGGTPDAVSQAVAGLGPRRSEVVVCAQFEARTAREAKDELEQLLRQLGTDYVDVLTYYYVEDPAEWAQIRGPGGALEYCLTARHQGRVRLLGLTSHQRPLAANVARDGQLDLLMIRYNAAHRGAETEVFPVGDALGIPIVAYTALRWGGLLRTTPDDPPGFLVPTAPDWYRFVLGQRSVTVALMAPADRGQLEEDLTVLELPPLEPEEHERLAAHGQRVRLHSEAFP